MTDTKAIDILNKLISEIDGLERDSSEHARWLSNVLRILDSKFGQDSQYSLTIRSFPWKETGSRIYRGYDIEGQMFRDNQNAFRRQMEQAKGIILSAVDALTENASESNGVMVQQETNLSKKSFDSKKVFVVHGHNQTVKQTVARTLENLGLTPIILAEQPDKGRTVIEKFESEGNDVGFAVVLLTADDKGRKNKARKMQSRARQNVVFEMGYFMALLRRERVMLLLQEGVEEPSDLKGIIYTALDKDGMWKYRLVKELQEQGYNVSTDSL
jgi:predicted nucleotide-binding protein